MRLGFRVLFFFLDGEGGRGGALQVFMCLTFSFFYTGLGGVRL